MESIRRHITHTHKVVHVLAINWSSTVIDDNNLVNAKEMITRNTHRIYKRGCKNFGS